MLIKCVKEIVMAQCVENLRLIIECPYIEKVTNYIDRRVNQKRERNGRSMMKSNGC